MNSRNLELKRCILFAYSHHESSVGIFSGTGRRTSCKPCCRRRTSSSKRVQSRAKEPGRVQSDVLPLRSVGQRNAGDPRRSLCVCRLAVEQGRARASNDREDESHARVDRPARQSRRTSPMRKNLVRLLHGVEGALSSILRELFCPTSAAAQLLAAHAQVRSNMAGMQKLMRSFERTLLPDDKAKEQCPLCLKSNCGAANFRDLDCHHGICGDCFVRLASLPVPEGNNMCPVCRYCSQFSVP